MAKKIILIFCVILTVLWFAAGWMTGKNKEIVNTPLQPPLTAVIEKKKNSNNTAVRQEKAIFVPYWSDFKAGERFDGYDRLVFFGLEADINGIKNEDLRFKKWGVISKNLPKGKKKLITINMLDTDVNNIILDEKEIWKKIADDTKKFIEAYGSDGVVLDLEMGGELPVNEKTSDKITAFVSYMSNKIRNYCSDSLSSAICQENKKTKFAVLLYGDTFYRMRPYDVKKIGEVADEVMIMAYDFHKSMGEPGPNMPLNRRSFGEGGSDELDYDYDFKTMVNDFSSAVPKEKLTVVYGMYGYDWMVDEKKRPINRAKSLTLNEIKKDFLNKCQWQSCTVRRDDLSAETEINYVKSEIKDDVATMYMHIIWFEDERSEKLKSDWLGGQGINNIAYWAYGYY